MGSDLENLLKALAASARPSAATPIALLSAVGLLIEPPHEHSWFVACQSDRHGLRVLDCACGARKRTRSGPAGTEDVIAPPPVSAMGDFLFDASTIPMPSL